MGITLDRAEKLLDLWLECDERISRGLSYTIGNRSYTRADASSVTEKINYWQNQITTLKRGSVRHIRQVTW